MENRQALHRQGFKIKACDILATLKTCNALRQAKEWLSDNDSLNFCLSKVSNLCISSNLTDQRGMRALHPSSRRGALFFEPVVHNPCDMPREGRSWAVKSSSFFVGNLNNWNCETKVVHYTWLFYPKATPRVYYWFKPLRRPLKN